jgi:hypothetical protein
MDLGTRLGSLKSSVKERATDAKLEKVERQNEGLERENELLKTKFEAAHEDRKRLLDALESLDTQKAPKKRRGGFLRMVVAGGVAYVLGARAGRERYEQIRTGLNKMRSRGNELRERGQEMAKGSVAPTPGSSTDPMSGPTSRSA